MPALFAAAKRTIGTPGPPHALGLVLSSGQVVDRYEGIEVGHDPLCVPCHWFPMLKIAVVSTMAA